MTHAPVLTLETEATLAAVKVLHDREKLASTRPAKDWLAHAMEHLLRKLDTDLRGGFPYVAPDARVPVLLEFLHSAARTLQQSAAALTVAAARLKDRGDVLAANQTRAAGVRAEEMAMDLEHLPWQ